MNTDLNLQIHERRIQSARISLFLIFAFSIVNVFSICFAESYFLFSSYFTQMLAYVGYALYLETANIVSLVLIAIVAGAVSVPYLLCGIFAKKRIGWLIAGLVIFGIDTVLLVIDTITSGEPSAFLMNIIIHAIVLVEQFLGIFSFKKIENLYLEELIKNKTQGEEEPTENPTVDSVLGSDRTITVTRKKAFVGAVMKLQVVVDGFPVAVLKNGETQTVSLNGDSHQMSIAMVNGFCDSQVVEIPVGEVGLSYRVYLKMGMSYPKAVIETVE